MVREGRGVADGVLVRGVFGLVSDFWWEVCRMVIEMAGDGVLL